VHVLFADGQPDDVADPADGADRDSHVLAAPQVPFLQDDVADVVAAGVDDQALDPPDHAVGGADRLAAGHVHLT
jgi:hypothetical protein